ncbi:MAG: hypothetical protein LDL41_05850 [Coleofasciculus sp. S288]|nr:hypothetical protein [Coleofasciculus sp. S288]
MYICQSSHLIASGYPRWVWESTNFLRVYGLIVVLGGIPDDLPLSIR